MDEIMLLTTIYGTQIFDQPLESLDETTKKQLFTAVMKAMTKAIKSEQINITKKSCCNCTWCNHYCDVTGKDEEISGMGPDYICELWRNDLFNPSSSPSSQQPPPPDADGETPHS